jgi:hypothetical protein
VTWSTTTFTTGSGGNASGGVEAARSKIASSASNRR